MAKYIHEIPHARAPTSRDFVPKTREELMQRRAARKRIQSVLDAQYRQLLAKLHTTRSPARTTLDSLMFSPWPFEAWEVATIIRLWVWENFHGQVGLESYEHHQRRVVLYW